MQFTHLLHCTNKSTVTVRFCRGTATTRCYVRACGIGTMNHTDPAVPSRLAASVGRGRSDGEGAWRQPALLPSALACRRINRSNACTGVSRPSSTATTAAVMGMSTPSAWARASTVAAL